MTLQCAQADAQAKELVARGEKAQQVVAVDVERRQLENRQKFADAGIRLEVERLRIQADKEVQQEFARALASFLSHGNMTLYGTPEMAQKMMDNMARGFGLRATVEGFLGGGNSHSDQGASRVDALLSDLGRLAVPTIENLTGRRADAVAPTGAAVDGLAAEARPIHPVAVTRPGGD